ncbi:MAG: tetratricopeptide repeat protein [Deltaproteobacteria bacterium]|nr:tetratricopeptide repeat protein [Deltaproteobacteria bacterium]
MLRSLTLYYRWWKTWGKLPVLSWMKAASFYRLKNYERAQQFYKQGLRSNPDHPACNSARLDLAYCLFKLRRFDEAQEQLRIIISKSPSTKDPHLRLTKIQMWIGHTLDAAWSARRAVQCAGPDPEMTALFLMNVLEHDGTSYLLQEALKQAEEIESIKREHPLLQAALAKLSIRKGEREQGRKSLLQVCSQPNSPFEAHLILAELLLEEGNIAQARQELKRAMTVVADHPRILSLFAETYLRSGPFYNPDYARQLATSACQNSNWSSPRELHILAESFYHVGDKISALVSASKAKDAGNRVLGSYRDVKNLDKLIETLSTGTQA